MSHRQSNWTSSRLSNSATATNALVLRDSMAEKCPRSLKLVAKDRHVLVDAVGRDLQVISHACRQRNQAALLGCIHALKGALFIVGERAAANACQAAEKRIHAQGIDNCARDVERLKQVLRQLLDRYAR